MKIEKIKKLSNGKYKIILENKESVTTYDEVILKNNLLYKKEIDDDLIRCLTKDNSYYDIYNKVVKLIEKRIRSEKEIREYLNKLEIDNDIINNVISSLKENGLINDYRFASSYISDRIYLNNEGINKIKNDLYLHNIDESIINECISKIDDEVIYNNLYKIMVKKIKQNHKYSRSILKQKLLSYFSNLGYEKEMILNIFDKEYVEDKEILNNEVKKIMNKLSKKYEGIELEYKLVAKLYQKGFCKEEIDKIKKDF